MARRAIVVGSAKKTEARLVSFLGFLGIEWEVLTAEDIVRRYCAENQRGRGNDVCLVACGLSLQELRFELKKGGIAPTAIINSFPQSLFHSFDHTPASVAALEAFIPGAKISVWEPRLELPRYSVSKDHQDLCGPLTGLSFASTENSGVSGMELGLPGGAAVTVISSDKGQVLTQVRQSSHESFVVCVPELLDLSQPTSKKIDFRSCFSSVVPILIALRWLFREVCWAPEAYYANVIIDDPPLWKTYGHFQLAELAALVDRTGCAGTVAMIPWNYKRSDRNAVRLLACRQPRLGVCVHGCDHTGAEFSCQDPERLMKMVTTAFDRMDWHRETTGLPYQPVMVFPQGIFSVEAMNSLKLAGYLAVANTEVSDCWGKAHLTFADLLQPSVSCYEGPPLFARRRPEDGVVNFAVDSFLGKPCLVVLHHGFFKDGIGNLERLIDVFAEFHPGLTWENLENIVIGCFLKRQEADGRKTIRIFADKASIRVSESDRGPLTVLRYNVDGRNVSRVEVNGQSADFSIEHGLMKISLEPQAIGNISLRIVNKESPLLGSVEYSVVEKARIAMRRYLCEFRDNYQAKSQTFLQRARSLAKSR